jgi:hypothetical protein
MGNTCSSYLPKRTSIIVTNEGNKIVEPNITELIPELYPCCRNQTFIRYDYDYHCNRIRDIFFFCANRRLPLERALREEVPLERDEVSLERDEVPLERDEVPQGRMMYVDDPNNLRKNLSYHIGELMSSNETQETKETNKPKTNATIVQVCDKAEKVCDALINNSHPLSKELFQQEEKKATTKINEQNPVEQDEVLNKKINYGMRETTVLTTTTINEHMLQEVAYWEGKNI